MSLVKMNFFSKYLGVNHDVAIILPDCPMKADPEKFYESKEKYKVLWLLHGSWGDYSDWLRKSMIELYATEKNLVVVMPTAMNSMYTNWAGFGLGYYWKDYFFKELMPMVYNWYPVSRKREDNFIAGLSMGGGAGAMKLAVNRPDLFSACAVLSSCPKNFHDFTMENVTQREMNDIVNFGGLENYIKSEENTWDILKTKIEQNVDLPEFYLCCGTDDPIVYTHYCDFKAYAQEIGFQGTFEEEDGYSHEWRFWDKYIQKALDFFGIEDVKGKKGY